MTALAAFIMRGPLQAALVASTLMLVALLSPMVLPLLLAGLVASPLLWMSSAALALVCLRQGLPAALKASAIALLAVMLVTASVGQPLMLTALLLILISWLPLLPVALLLRNSVSLALALQAIGLLALLALLGFYLVVGDPAAMWHSLLSGLMEPMLQEQSLSVDEITQLFSLLSSVMTTLMVTSLISSLAASLLLARWWQALLYNPGGFREEFQALRLGKTASGIALLLFALSMLTDAPIADELASIAVTLFLFQGLAIAHSIVVLKQMGRGWLIGLYALLLVQPMPLLLGCVGVVDAWADFRARVGKSISNP